MSKLTRKNYLRALKVIKAANRVATTIDLGRTIDKGNVFERARKILATMPGTLGNHALGSSNIPGAYHLIFE